MSGYDLWHLLADHRREILSMDLIEGGDRALVFTLAEALPELERLFRGR